MEDDCFLEVQLKIYEMLQNMYIKKKYPTGLKQTTGKLNAPCLGLQARQPHKDRSSTYTWNN